MAVSLVIHKNKKTTSTKEVSQSIYHLYSLVLSQPISVLLRKLLFLKASASRVVMGWGRWGNSLTKITGKSSKIWNNPIKNIRISLYGRGSNLVQSLIWKGTVRCFLWRYPNGSHFRFQHPKCYNATNFNPCDHHRHCFHMPVSSPLFPTLVNVWTFLNGSFRAFYLWRNYLWVMTNQWVSVINSQA